MKRIIAVAWLMLTTVLCGCGIFDFVKTSNTEEPTAEKPTEVVTEEATEVIEETGPTFLGGYIFPTTDGSTSTTNLDKAVRKALLGTAEEIAHSTTYQSFYNLLDQKVQVIFTTPLSDSQLDTMERKNFTHEAEPVAGEGFVFVVNKDNPVDTLTIEQIKSIYSGEITNWSEVGGDDSEIVAYQRNQDSGSQNYMLAFMGDTPLMKPVTESVPASMRGVLDAVANYDNSKYAIGYSVYAYSDGMYEDISKIKYVKVNGVEPTLKSMADGSYPLLGYNYAVFSADEPEDSGVRALVEWIQSDEGQQVLADAGYIPYRKVEGLTLPAETKRKLYYSVSTSDIKMPGEMADYYYYCSDVSDDFTTETLGNKVREFVDSATAELSKTDPKKVDDFVTARFDYANSNYYTEYIPKTVYSLKNGYLSVTVGITYQEPFQDFRTHYYDARTAVFDIYTGERLVFSDLFFEGVDFVSLVNDFIAKSAELPSSNMNTFYNMVSDFKGLYEGDFEFTADSIIFKPGVTFADGVILSLSELSEYMVTSVPRDMKGILNENIPVYMNIKQLTGITVTENRLADTVGYYDEYISVSHLDPQKTPTYPEAINNVNSFIDKLCEFYFSREKLVEYAQSRGVTAESVIIISPFPSINIEMVGTRFFKVSAPSDLRALSNGKEIDMHIEGKYTLRRFFNAKTGEELKIGDLFEDGWRDDMFIAINNESFNEYDEKTWVKYTGDYNTENGKITEIDNYTDAQIMYGDKRDKDIPVCVYITTEGGDNIVVLVPQKYR